MISRGSEWHRWEPHIHAPGTILNNQFGATDPWGAYLTSLEGLTPKVEAVAVTDYYVTDTYEEFLKHKAAGRLQRFAGHVVFIGGGPPVWDAYARFVSHWDVTRLPYDGPADRWFDARWLTRGGDVAANHRDQ
ncbi:hypothetical protein [Mesorhizobium sp.]|uniref:hypothetical protein n=1 Tax=Mesorhizobium sp. TaxID=1871066 RepID=UPI000FE80257|nr:hypothetical protein [Mesorhizobium sp.]RWK76789.1 MAG: hypothetical protein EOR50_13725 [Mesorhizobium sp.]RWP80322.1 MAG: hypothetical protein EOR09_00595 [Mesorhizobium sp.]